MNTLIEIAGLAILCLLAEILNWRKAIVPITIAGLIGTLALTLCGFESTSIHYKNMIVVNPFSATFSSLFIVLTIFLIAMSPNFYAKQITKISDFVAIKLFLLTGAIAMVSFGNLSMFFLGLEVLSIALYILAASNRTYLKSNEAGMKYFLMGAFASGIILFGICMIYGATGSFDIATIAQAEPLVASWFYIGIALLTIGILFKIAAVPFHFWAPDVYEGAPALTTAAMSTLVKIAAIATLYKLLSSMNVIMTVQYGTIIVVVSIASMTLGNIMALKQNNIKRMLAFSGISHAGFMLMTLLSLSSSASILLYYATAYSLAGIAAFAVILFVTTDKDNENIENFNGLGKTNFLMAVILTGALLSMAGIPIFSGFFAKFFLLNATLQTGYLVLVIVGIINSIISVGYYFKVIIAMYSKEPASIEKQKAPYLYTIVAVVAIAINILIGLFPSCILEVLG